MVRIGLVVGANRAAPVILISATSPPLTRMLPLRLSNRMRDLSPIDQTQQAHANQQERPVRRHQRKQVQVWLKVVDPGILDRLTDKASTSRPYRRPRCS